MKLLKKSSMAALLGIFALSLAVTMPVKAEKNPFAAPEIVTIVAHDDEKKGKCGEGKCGEGKMKAKAKGKCGEGKCGEGKMKAKGKMKAEEAKAKLDDIK